LRQAFHSSAEKMPMQVEDGLPASLSDAHEEPVIGQTRGAGRLGDELQHPLRLVRRQLADLLERGSVTVRDDQKMSVGARVDVANREEAVGSRDVIAFGRQPAEDAILRQRESPPR
jgi:hypothetical protein